MRELVLKPKSQPQVGLEAEVITPDIFAGKSLSELGELPVFEGKVERKLKDFFDISGEAAETKEDTRIVIDGDVGGTKRIGQEMTAGEILIKGNVGMHLGSKMKGGKIVVEGDVDAFACQEMRGGDVHIKGNAGNYLGSARRGNWRGMRGGTITVEGNAGSEIGVFMQGGKITVRGDAKPFAGVHMKKGLIVIKGTAARRVGAEMTGGTIVVNKVEAMLPGFKLEGTEKDPSIDDQTFKGSYKKYSGDHVDLRAKGVVLVKA